MTINAGFGMGGYGVEASDPNFQDKIAKLKQKHQSGAQKIDSFLTDDLGIDPRSLPLAKGAADHRFNAICQEAKADHAQFDGTSMGLNRIILSNANPARTCPSCGQPDGEWLYNDATGEYTTWYCYNCDVEDNTPPTPEHVATLTEVDHGSVDWHDLVRCYNAFSKALDGARKLTAQSTYGAPTLTVREKPLRSSDPLSYPTDSVLRIERTMFHEDGDPTIDHLYVRVGGLFSDTDIVILPSMKPIADLSGWTVVEELS